MNPKATRPEDRGHSREQMNACVEELTTLHAAIITPNKRNVGAFEYALLFPFSGIIRVYVRVLLKEWQTNSDVVIGNMVLHPEGSRSQGYGSTTIGYLREWALRHSFNEIRATQASNERSRNFWMRNGFIPIPPPDKCKDLILSLNPPLS